MANILQLVQHLQIGGLEKMALALSNKSQLNSRTAIVALEGTRRQAIEQWPELAEVDRLACLNKPAKVSWSVVKKLVNIIDIWQIKVIHSHHIGPMLYASIVKLLRPKVKHISTVHDAWYLENDKARWMSKLICKFTPVTLVADAQAVAEEWRRQGLAPANYIVVNGVDCDSFYPVSKSVSRHKLGLPHGPTIIGCAARVEAGKGHEVLLKTLSHIPENTHLAFAGEGSLKQELQELSESLGLADRVHWLGCVQDMRAFYSCIDVFCLFSEREGMPLTVLEAMSCNTPVVASNVGGIKEVLTSKTGVLVPANKPYLLPRAFKKAHSLKSGMLVRQHALKNTDLTCMAGRYDTIYQSLI